MIADPSPRTPSPSKKRLLIVDDHPIMRQGLQQLLSDDAHLEVAALADSAAQAVTELRARAFDLAIIDISLRGVSGLDLLKEIQTHWPEMPVLVLSMHDELLYAERALRAGALGYVMKQEPTECIVAAIHCVLGGRPYVSEAIKGRLAGAAPMGESPRAGSGPIKVLSGRELEVFRLIGRGWGTRAIAEEMHLSVKTVETYRAHIKEKLKLKDAPDLMRHAVNWVNSQEAL
jgi:DNA-binding NarL/FixJ family response regulator